MYKDGNFVSETLFAIKNKKECAYIGYYIDFLNSERTLKTLVSVDVLVCLGCYNQILQTGWLIDNRQLFLTVFEAESPRLRCQRGCLLVRVPFSVHNL